MQTGTGVHARISLGKVSFQKLDQIKFIHKKIESYICA